MSRIIRVEQSSTISRECTACHSRLDVMSLVTGRTTENGACTESTCLCGACRELMIDALITARPAGYDLGGPDDGEAV